MLIIVLSLNVVIWVGFCFEEQCDQFWIRDGINYDGVIVYFLFLYFIGLFYNLRYFILKKRVNIENFKMFFLNFLLCLVESFNQEIGKLICIYSRYFIFLYLKSKVFFLRSFFSLCVKYLFFIGFYVRYCLICVQCVVLC